MSNLANAAYAIFSEIETITNTGWNEETKNSIFRFSELESALLSIYRLFNDEDMQAYTHMLVAYLRSKKTLTPEEYEVIMAYAPEFMQEFTFIHYSKVYMNLNHSIANQTSLN